MPAWAVEPPHVSFSGQALTFFLLSSVFNFCAYRTHSRVYLTLRSCSPFLNRTVIEVFIISMNREITRDTHKAQPFPSYIHTKSHGCTVYGKVFSAFKWMSFSHWSPYKSHVSIRMQLFKPPFYVPDNLESSTFPATQLSRAFVLISNNTYFIRDFKLYWVPGITWSGAP